MIDHPPSIQCQRICCRFDRERANRSPGRRNLTPLIAPAAATREAVAGDSTSGAVAGEVQTAPGFGGVL